MHDAVRVRKGDRVADAKKYGKPVADTALRRQPLVEALAADALHRVVHAAIGQLAEVVNGDDAGVLEAGEDASLAGHRARRAGVRPAIGGRAVHDLQRDLPTDRVVLPGTVDDAETSFTQSFDDRVAADHDAILLDKRQCFRFAGARSAGILLFDGGGGEEIIYLLLRCEQ